MGSIPVPVSGAALEDQQKWGERGSITTPVREEMCYPPWGCFRYGVKTRSVLIDRPDWLSLLCLGLLTETEVLLVCDKSVCKGKLEVRDERRKSVLQVW